ncbi:MAG: class I SAM-dependent methyltransferase [Flaviflexus sp.]|nr:class I SAM-dependent methyltransferase [Flaviflexus sp.]
MLKSRTTWGGDKPEIYERSFASMCAGAIPFILRAAAPGIFADVGCGAGHLSQAAASWGAQVVALDAEAQMIELTRRRCAGSSVTATVASLPDLAGVERDAADTVACSFVLNHLTDPVASMTALVSLAHPGGRIITTLWPATYTAHRSITTSVMDRAGATRSNADQPHPTPAGRRPLGSATGIIRGVMDELRIADLPSPKAHFEHSPRGLAELTARAGLHVDTATIISWTWQIPWENYLEGIRGGIAGVGERYQRQEESVRREIDAKLLEAMIPYGAPGLLRLPCHAAFCVASKPKK